MSSWVARIRYSVISAHTAAASGMTHSRPMISTRNNSGTRMSPPSVGWYSSIALLRESCRPFTDDAESFLQRDAHLPNQPVIEQPAEDGDPVRHAARRVELR